jgi:hypothetical protein
MQFGDLLESLNQPPLLVACNSWSSLRTNRLQVSQWKRSVRILLAFSSLPFSVLSETDIRILRISLHPGHISVAMSSHPFHSGLAIQPPCARGSRIKHYIVMTDLIPVKQPPVRAGDALVKNSALPAPGGSISTAVPPIIGVAGKSCDLDANVILRYN